MSIECKRHGFPYGRDAALAEEGALYYVSRCAHLESRFIVEIKPADGHPFIVIDYVEDIEATHLLDSVIVEAHSRSSQDEADEMWLELERKMRAGIAPDPLESA